MTYHCNNTDSRFISPDADNMKYIGEPQSNNNKPIPANQQTKQARCNNLNKVPRTQKIVVGIGYIIHNDVKSKQDFRLGFDLNLDFGFSFFD